MAGRNSGQAQNIAQDGSDGSAGAGMLDIPASIPCPAPLPTYVAQQYLLPSQGTAILCQQARAAAILQARQDAMMQLLQNQQVVAQYAQLRQQQPAPTAHAYPLQWLQLQAHLQVQSQSRLNILAQQQSAVQSKAKLIQPSQAVCRRMQRVRNNSLASKASRGRYRNGSTTSRCNHLSRLVQPTLSVSTTTRLECCRPHNRSRICFRFRFFIQSICFCDLYFTAVQEVIGVKKRKQIQQVASNLFLVDLLLLSLFSRHMPLIQRSPRSADEHELKTLPPAQLQLQLQHPTGF
jgi:hypothetical protein